MELIKESKIPYFEGSALSGSMVEECFWKKIELVHQMLRCTLELQGDLILSIISQNVQLEESSIFEEMNLVSRLLVLPS